MKKFVNGLGLWGLFMVSDAVMDDVYALMEANPNSGMLLIMALVLIVFFIYSYGRFAEWLVKN